MAQRPGTPQITGSPTAARANRNSETAVSTLIHQYFVQVQDGMLHPACIPVNSMERVLDLGCGAGEWVFDLARRYPKLHIYGVDANEDVLRRAKVRRNRCSLRQVELRQMDITQPLSIPDEYLDFVHMRRCSRFIKPPHWPGSIQESVRVLKPGGWLTIVEIELCQISSPACLAVLRTITQAKVNLGHSMDATGLTMGIAAHLYGMLLQTQLEEVAYDLHTIDLGFMGGQSARLLLREYVRHAALFRPLIVQQDLLSAPEFDELIVQANLELQAPDLCGWGVLISAYGRKPEAAETERRNG